MKKISGIIPTLFYVRTFLGVALLMGFAIAFAIVLNRTLSQAVEIDSLICFSQYRTVQLGIMTLLSINIADPDVLDTSPTGVPMITNELSTYPVWNDQRHMSSDCDTVKLILNRTIQFFDALHRKVKEGGKVGTREFILTGDDAIDETSTSRTIYSGSRLSALMMNSQACYEYYPGDCDIPDRIYNHRGDFAGLEGLIQEFLSQALALTNTSSQPPMSHTSVQFMNTAMNYDLRAGMNNYSTIMVQEFMEKTNSNFVGMVVLFVFTVIFMLVAFFLCLIPTRDTLFKVALCTIKIADLDPSAASSHDAIAEWSEEYSCDVQRFDDAHKRVVDALRELVQGIEEMEDGGFGTKEGGEAGQGAGSSGSSGSGGGGGGMEGDEFEDSDLQNRKRLKQLLRAFVFGFFRVLSDEEKMMSRAKVSNYHINAHKREHITFIKRVLQSSLRIAVSKVIEAGTGEITELTQTVNMWMSDHMTHTDRELGTLLVGKTSQGRLEKIIDLTVWEVPPSYVAFLDSDNADLKSREQIENLQRMLE